jgi:thiosulfate/3-mercaptopyruvate sulfurtransferase
MICRFSIVLVILCFTSCKDDKTVTTEDIQDHSIESIETNYLIEIDELLKISKEPHIKILDFRKAIIYKEEHIEGALNIWRTDIEDTSYSYKGMMAGKDQIETLFSNLGMSTNDTIIIYDDNALCDSSRLWWLLQNYDFKNVRLFHGGITAWKSKNGPISKEVPLIQKAVFKLTETPSLKYYITKEEMLQAVTNNTLILDTRTNDEYTGKRQKMGAAKGGRIPNSKFFDWAAAVNYDGDKRMKGIEELQKIYNALGVKKSDTIIAYCHSGVRSAHTTFVLTQLLGYKNVKNYDGSWIEWSQFNDYPFEQDSITTIIK